MEKSIRKVSEKYYCKKCDYTTSVKSNYKKHLTTSKHKNGNNDNKNDNIKVSKMYVCDFCERSFCYRSGLSRHIKNCKVYYDKQKYQKSISSQNKKKEQSEEDSINSKMLLEVLEQNQNLQKQLFELSKQKQTINYTDCNNKKMTINIFLNEQCKDAMNLTDFIENLKVSLEDLNYTMDNGYVKGISNIFLKHLQHMEPTQRPIHCSDIKRLQFYVKDENKWEKDDKKIQKTISEVSQKQTQQIKEWEKQYPEWNKSDKETEMYLQMVKQVMGGNLEENSEEIKRNISEVIELKNTTIE
jgi:hypothetical protein